MNALSSYKNGREHLADELLKLDALLELRVLKHREISTGPEPDDFAGLYITGEEIDRVSGKMSKMEKKENSKTAGEKKALQAHIKKLEEALTGKIENSLKTGIDLPIYYLASLFQLNSFEWDTLIICLAPELDVKYEKLYAYLQDDVTKKSPSVNLILDLLCGSSNQEERIDAHICFFDQSPLLKYQLVKFTNDNDSQSKPLLSRCLKIDERIAHFLLGFNVMDSRLSSYAQIINPQKEWTSLVMEEKLKKQLIGLANDYFENYFMKTGKRGLVFYLKGPYGAGKKSTAEAICHQLELPLIIVDTRDLLVLNSEPGFEKVVKRFFREAILHSAAIYFEDFDRLVTNDYDRKGDIYRKMIIRAVEEFPFITFLAGEKEWHSQGGLKSQAFVTIELPVPAYPLRKHLWKKFVNDINIDGVANKFNFTGGQIRDAAVEAGNLAMIRCCGDNCDGEITIEDLYRGCSRQSNRKLSEMARKIKPRYTWSDIVLPGDKLQQLKEIRNYVKYRQVIYHDWGFDRKLSLGKGLNILFPGLSGTGKTMAADVIANELHLDYYKIDLSCVVSKYIGETEKNLAAIFREAETANAILFFDEADALFGKRSEVKDSHDRYANIEIGYLLQKMEEYEGVVILATNMRKNMDEAFVRRMHFTVEFPFPEETSRRQIWKNIFPSETPLGKNIDFNFLTRNFKIAGGNIKNIALTAAFYAADDGKVVTMQHLVLAAKREFQKMGKLCLKDDFGTYYELIQNQDE
ncbi:MAG: AAA family ATPase [Candidatus Aminicenantes bacterium]|nr:AAA family ATPase [Candidatus Aminicenantes bacterium]NIM81060.1 AAA family ATPase [Candidatus Aminicenantes bacterium]NIN20437.1 AAA family ATPase [Candidatus Aminicenantes bacterium]NIN44210.1 AAA family ATPase [Candidatus Aminicenantes bacterium]NIN87028.1 AAA family ATPase [Candidatus Aminicenantes bacterium]